MVAKGYSQQPEIDYDQTYSPIVKYDSLRAILAISTAEDLELFQLDVTNAFLHGVLKEKIYLAQPEGHVKTGQERMVTERKKNDSCSTAQKPLWLETGFPKWK